MEERSVVTVFSPETEWQGQLIVQELKDAGIEAYLANGATSAALWGGVAPLSDLEVLVPEEQQGKAKEIIDEFLSRHGALPTEAQDADLPESEEETEP